MKNDLVSVIIPVYNTEKYLDECLESIVNQTYKNIEIILVNDGSTDNSAQICKNWINRDSRIRYYEQENKGQGPARNLGVREAKGEWIVFVDSDDWIDLEYIDKLYDAAKKYNADLVDCNYYQKSSGSSIDKKANDFCSIGCKLTEEFLQYYLYTGIWRRLIKKTLLTDYNIEQPKGKSQDLAVGCIISQVAQKRVTVDDVLYYYRRGREGSTTTGKNCNRKDIVFAMQWLIDLFIQNKIYHSNIDVLRHQVSMIFSRCLISAWNVEEKKEYCELRDECMNCWEQNFIGEKDLRIMHIGGWNLMSVVRMFPFIQDINMSFQFSSLISMINPGSLNLIEEHKNIFRKKMIKRDIQSEFFEIIEENQIDYLVLDLLEERHDIIKTDGGYVTKSDALDKCEFIISSEDILCNESEEWFELWKESCDKFIEIIQKRIEINKIILVKNYLADRYGDIKQQIKYENVEWIHRKNTVLKKCYEYIENKYSEIQIIDISEDENYFTDIDYEYGKEPQYLNTIVNIKMMNEIKKYLI